MLSFYIALLETEEQKCKLEYIYRKYNRYMLCIAFQVAGSHYLAEDAVHETFLNLIRIIDDIRSNNEQELKSFLKILTTHHTIDLMRKMNSIQRKDKEMEVIADIKEDISVEAVVLGKIDYENMMHIIMDMDEKYKTPLSLKIQGYKTSEIAKMLEISQENVKIRLYRARKFLLKKLEESHE